MRMSGGFSAAIRASVPTTGAPQVGAQVQYPSDQVDTRGVRALVETAMVAGSPLIPESGGAVVEPPQAPTAATSIKRAIRGSVMRRHVCNHQTSAPGQRPAHLAGGRLNFSWPAANAHQSSGRRR